MKTVLLLEDDPECSKMISDFLETHGFTVISRKKPHEAIHFFLHNLKEISTVITDGDLGVKKEDADSVDFVHVVVKESFSGPIISISGSEDWHATHMKEGCTHANPKPVDLKLLIAAVK